MLLVFVRDCTQHTIASWMYCAIHRLTHIYLDTIPPTDVVWNDVATDKLTTQDGDKFQMGAGIVANAPHRLTPVLPRHTT